MAESLYYLFLSGLILGSGPCVGFCAPILVSFVATFKPSFKKAIISYVFFSSAKTLSYVILGALCGIFSGILRSNIFAGYLNFINFVFGGFILLVGILTAISKDPLSSKYCRFISEGNLRNAGLLGFLAGFAPCLPLLGILDYIIIISHSAFDAAIYAFAFGLGTAISPVILLIGLSGKISGYFGTNKKIKILIRIISSSVLIFLAVKILIH